VHTLSPRQGFRGFIRFQVSGFKTLSVTRPKFVIELLFSVYLHLYLYFKMFAKIALFIAGLGATVFAQEYIESQNFEIESADADVEAMDAEIEAMDAEVEAMGGGRRRHHHNRRHYNGRRFHSRFPIFYYYPMYNYQPPVYSPSPYNYQQQQYGPVTGGPSYAPPMTGGGRAY